MKKKNLIFVIAMIIAITYSWNKAFSQATSICTTCPVIGAPNTSPNAATDYLGWAAGVNQPLNIGNYDPQLINFFTNSNPSGQIDPTLTNNTSFGYLTFGSLTSESQIPTRFSFTSSGLQSERRRIYIKYLNRIQYISDKYKAKTSANGVLA